jgi:amino-acid N-acetyltransferase
MTSDTTPSFADNPALFVQWLRDVAPYVHTFRDKTFVIAFDGELVEQGHLEDLAYDVSLLRAMGMRIVLVHGARPQIEKQLSLRGKSSEFLNGIRITSSSALNSVKEASGALRLSIEAAFSQGLPNTPMAGSDINVISGNFVTAKPIGVLNGVDFQHTGEVRKVAHDDIIKQLAMGNVVLLSPLGFSPTGEAFNLTNTEVAAAVASALKADKLIMMSDQAVLDENGLWVSEYNAVQARAAAESLALDHPLRPWLQAGYTAVENGVARAHIIPSDLDGSLLLELFRHEGVGTMITTKLLETIRPATPDDLGGILQLITPLEQNGTLVPRGREKLEAELPLFSVIEHDNYILGCAALYPFEPEKMAEMACFSIDATAQGTGLGSRILKHMEQRAKAEGFKHLFVLTTRAAHWFLKNGFVAGTIDDLPSNKQSMYNWQRKSQIFIKKIV